MSHIKQIKPSAIRRALRLHEEWVEYLEHDDPCSTTIPQGKEIVLTNEIIRKINFTESDLFAGANLRKLNASNLDFSRINFSRANFSETDFEGANFENTKFLSTDFKNSVFSGAKFSNAIFTGIALQYTVTAGIQGFQVISCQLNTSEENRVVQYWPALDIVTAGCFSGTLKELKKKIKETHKDNPDMRKKYNLVLDYIDAMVKLG